MKLKNKFETTCQNLKGLTKRYLHGLEGIAAVEFALIAPMMILLFLGTVEVSYAISVDRKMSRTASSVADLITQEVNTITVDAVNEILSISGEIMQPYDVIPCIVVTGISIEDSAGSREATVLWSLDNASHTGASPSTVCNAGATTPLDIARVARAEDSIFPVPDTMKANNDFLVATEVFLPHSPIIGVASYNRSQEARDIGGAGELDIQDSIINLDDVIYLRPRSGLEIELDGS